MDDDVARARMGEEDRADGGHARGGEQRRFGAVEQG